MSIKSATAKVAWDSTSSSLIPILGPLFHLFRCFGLDFHPLSSPRHPLVIALLKMARCFWVLLALGTCFYYLVVRFPGYFFNPLDHGQHAQISTSFLHFAIEFLNYWIYNLAIFSATWCLSRSSSARDLWTAVDELLLQVPLSREDVNRCRRTTCQCVVGVLVVVRRVIRHIQIP